MTTLYQYCEKCKTERNFNPDTLECNTCKTKQKNGHNDRKSTDSSRKSERGNRKKT